MRFVNSVDENQYVGMNSSKKSICKRILLCLVCCILFGASLGASLGATAGATFGLTYSKAEHGEEKATTLSSITATVPDNGKV